jgi:hypothetical protein
VRTATTRLSYPEIKLEASKLGLEWGPLTGFWVTVFEDGTSYLRAEDARADTGRLLAHLIEHGLATGS